VERGTLIAGENAQAGEFGLLSVEPQGELSSTGVRGAWEAYSSGRGIPQFVAHRYQSSDTETPPAADDSPLVAALADGEAITSQTVYTLAADGDPFARACLEEIHRYNAVGVAGLCNAFNPGLLTLGGGVALNNAEETIAGIERFLGDYLFVDRPEIRITALGDDIGLYGSLAIFLDQSGEHALVGDPRTAASRTD
jgi:glucokinase